MVAKEPGQVLKALRAAQGWTLAEVKERTGLPISTLSKLENGKMGLSYDKLMKLGHGLGVDMAQLLSNAQGSEADARNITASLQLASGRRAITRANEGHSIETPLYQYSCHAVELLKRSLHPMIVEVSARSIEEFTEFTWHAGEEFAYVLEGTIEFHCDLYAPVILSVGDSIYFDAGTGHAFVAASAGRCRILSVSTNIPNL